MEISRMQRVPKHLYQYRSLDTTAKLGYLHDLLFENRLRFSRPAEFNDPFELHFRVIAPACRTRDIYIDRISKQYRRSRDDVGRKIDSPEWLQSASKTWVTEVRERTTVFCCSETCSDPAMWAYYADKHKGVCVEVRSDVSIAELIRVGYPDGKETPQIPIDQIKTKDARLTVLSTKSPSWKHEMEWRFIRLHEHAIPQDDIVILPPDMVTGLVLGHKIDESIEAIIRGWVRALGGRITLWKGALDSSRYEIVRHQLTCRP